MAFCSFSKEAGMYDVTPIENLFLLEFLPTAPEGFLRVYLYARMLCIHPEMGDGIEDMARALHMDVDAIQNAMTYWERQGLVCRLSDRKPEYMILPMRGLTPAADPMERDYYEYRDFNASLQALFGADNLLQPKHYGMANDWLNVFGLTQDAVLKMIELKLSHSRARKPDSIFSGLKDKVPQWAERGMRTAEDVEKIMLEDEQVDKTAAAIMKRFSMYRPATEDEKKLVGRWLKEWNFSQKEILEACAETTKSRTPTLAYLNTILENRMSGGDALFEGAKLVLKELDPAAVQPSPDQVRSYGAMLSTGFEPETIRLAAVQCSRKRKKRFEDLEWMVGEWSKMGLYRHADADAYIRNMSRATASVRELLKKCGSDRSPQMSDIALYEGWRNQHSEEIIGYAAECARGMQLPMRYIDKLLAEWQKSGVTSVDAARAQHEGRAKPAAAGAPAVNPALNYEQRKNTDDDYAGLLIDLNQDFGNGGNEA